MGVQSCSHFYFYSFRYTFVTPSGFSPIKVSTLNQMIPNSIDSTEVFWAQSDVSERLSNLPANRVLAEIDYSEQTQ
jgi:hypothetical protein